MDKLLEPRKMKIYLTSDVHTEKANRKFIPTFDYECLQLNYPQDADVIILAGDVGEWINGIEWSRNCFKNKEIIYVAGNHEFYDSDLSIIGEMREKAKELNIHFLDNDAVTIDGVRFLGSTLWSDFNSYSAIEIEEAWKNLNDYRYIKCQQWWENKQNKARAMWLMNLESKFGFEPEYFSPTVAYLLHKESLNWLNQELNKSYKGKTVIITHHAPSIRSTVDSDYSYASNLERLIEKFSSEIDLWCHGHIHKPVDYEISGVRIISNPRCYPNNDSKEFNATKTIWV